MTADTDGLGVSSMTQEEREKGKREALGKAKRVQGLARVVP